MSISSDNDCIEQQKKNNVEHEEDHGEAQADVLHEEPELGMTFDTENDVREAISIGLYNSKFKEFQEELTHTMYCDREFIQKQGAVETYKITEDVLIDKEEGWRKDYVYHVYFNAEEFEVKCSCRQYFVSSKYLHF
jgi:hypothetical protein